jgi:hypothetical protein
VFARVRSWASNDTMSRMLLCDNSESAIGYKV